VYLKRFVECEASEISSWFSTREESLLWGGRVFSWPIDTDEIIKRSRQEHVEFFTLSSNHEVCGFIEFQHINAQEMRLCRVAVSPKYRRQGLGKLLVGFSLKEIRRRKQYQFVTLAVFTTNIIAHSCYRSLGFIVVDKEPKFKIFGGEHWPLIQMEIVL